MASHGRHNWRRSDSGEGQAKTRYGQRIALLRGGTAWYVPHSHGSPAPHLLRERVRHRSPFSHCTPACRAEVVLGGARAPLIEREVFDGREKSKPFSFHPMDEGPSLPADRAVARPDVIQVEIHCSETLARRSPGCALVCWIRLVIATDGLRPGRAGTATETVPRGHGTLTKDLHTVISPSTTVTACPPISDRPSSSSTRTKIRPSRPISVACVATYSRPVCSRRP
jgi:hypothetical protein